MDYTKINHRISNLEIKKVTPLNKFNNRDITAKAVYFWTESHKSYNQLKSIVINFNIHVI